METKVNDELTKLAHDDPDFCLSESNSKKERKINLGYQEMTPSKYKPVKYIEHFNSLRSDVDTIVDEKPMIKLCDENSDFPVKMSESVVQEQRQLLYTEHQEMTQVRPFKDIEHRKSRLNFDTIVNDELISPSQLTLGHEYSYSNIPVEKNSEFVAQVKRKITFLGHQEETSNMKHSKSDFHTLFNDELFSQLPLKLENPKSVFKEPDIEYNGDESLQIPEEASPPKSFKSFHFDKMESLRNNFKTIFDEDPYSQTPLKHMNTEKKKASKELAEDFLKIEQDLAQKLLSIDYTDTKVRYISNPIEHAIEPHTSFLETYLNGKKSVLFLGMNPGPWGMCQTGIPFGEVQSCKTWLKISGNVTKPTHNHPKRPIEGFACKRREVSGERFWKFFETKCEKPESFFKNCFVYNHCPLAYMTETGKNITPPEIKAEKRMLINSYCDKALVDVIRLLGVSSVIGVGKFAEARANAIKKKLNLDITVFYLLHPSPASPVANKGWSVIAETSLKNMNILDFL